MRHQIMLGLLYAVKLSTGLRVFVSRDGPGPRIPSRWQNPVWIRVADKITNTHHVCEYIYRLPSSLVESTSVEVAGKNSFLMFCKDVAQVTNAEASSSEHRVLDGPFIFNCGDLYTAMDPIPFTNSWGQPDHYGVCRRGEPPEKDTHPFEISEGRPSELKVKWDRMLESANAIILRQLRAMNGPIHYLADAQPMFDLLTCDAAECTGVYCLRGILLIAQNHLSYLPMSFQMSRLLIIHLLSVSCLLTYSEHPRRGPRVENRFQNPYWIKVRPGVETSHELCQWLYKADATVVESTDVSGVMPYNSIAVSCKDIERLPHSAGHQVKAGIWILYCGHHHVAEGEIPFVNSWQESDTMGRCVPGDWHPSQDDPELSESVRYKARMKYWVHRPPTIIGKMIHGWEYWNTYVTESCLGPVQPRVLMSPIIGLESLRERKECLDLLGENTVISASSMSCIDIGF